MIISHSNNFIFLRVPKNASTSVATFMINNLCDQNDKYTKINDSQIPSVNVPQEIINKYKHDYRFIHLTLNELVENNLVDKDKAAKMKVITIIRDPFDRQISLYCWKNKGNRSPDDFRRQFSLGHHQTDRSNKITQYQYGCLGDNHVAECWLYQDIDLHLQEFVSQLGVDINIDLAKYKSNMRSGQMDDFYDQHTRSAVERYYEKDFEIYNRLVDENRSRFNYSAQGR